MSHQVSPASEQDNLSLPQLRCQVRQLQQALARAQRLAAVGTMAAMVAHEFNNLLTPMLNYAQMAAGGDPQMQAKAIHHTLDGATRAAAICGALLDMGGAGSDRKRQVALDELVEQTLAAMARDMAKDGINLVRKIPPRLTLTTCPGQFKQVLLNLLLNARWAAMEKGRGQSVSIVAEQADGQVFLRVADTGVGIDPQHMEKIFEPFFTTRDSGTGLGLAVSRQIIEELSGRLEVRSELGKGTVFTIALPADVPAVRRKARPTALSA